VNRSFLSAFFLTVIPLSVVAPVLSAAGNTVPANGSIQSAVHDLYNSRFASSRRTLHDYSSLYPDDPLAYALKSATYLFAELDRSGALTRSFLTDDRNVASKNAAHADPDITADLNTAVKQARHHARLVLNLNPNDRNALLAICIVSGVQRDHLALAEHKLRESYPFMRESQIYAERLLQAHPTAYDAYLTKGFTEYVVASLPFYIRWFMKLDNLTGTKQKGFDDLQIAAESGQYMKPFAQLLLAMFYLRENREDKSERLLAQLAGEYPENMTFRSEWEKLKERRRPLGD
jgi:hypothetical protein